MVDIPEEEARYWTYKLEQINVLGADSEVGTALYAIQKDGENFFLGHYSLPREDLGAC